jgi:ubiquinone/menaquinone biosynthesis C-methylase UbiE
MLLVDEYRPQEVTVQEGYDRWAATYDSENPLIAVEEPYVDTLLARLPITSALDVGTGTGRYALKLARRGIAVTAIDQSPEMLAVAKQVAQAEGLTVDFQLVSLDHDLPFESGQFDFLICALMLCHVPNLARAFQAFARVLQADGTALITAFHPEVIGQGWRTVFGQSGITYQIPNMLHTRADYLQGLTLAGLTPLTVIDALFREVPDGSFSPAMIAEHGHKPFCLIIVAQKIQGGHDA